jgi:hypothetical protein
VEGLLFPPSFQPLAPQKASEKHISFAATLRALDDLYQLAVHAVQAAGQQSKDATEMNIADSL